LLALLGPAKKLGPGRGQGAHQPHPCPGVRCAPASAPTAVRRRCRSPRRALGHVFAAQPQPPPSKLSSLKLDSSQLKLKLAGYLPVFQPGELTVPVVGPWVCLFKSRMVHDALARVSQPRSCGGTWST
jgi:hypothetical protein